MATTFHHAPQVDLFVAELLGGQLHGVQPRPAKTLDVHCLYRAWCAKRQIPVLDAGHLARMLAERHGMPLLRKRYALGSSVHGPHGVIYLACPPAPAAGFELDWLGRHVSAFIASVATYSAAVGVPQVVQHA